MEQTWESMSKKLHKGILSAITELNFEHMTPAFSILYTNADGLVNKIQELNDNYIPRAHARYDAHPKLLFPVRTQVTS